MSEEEKPVPLQILEIKSEGSYESSRLINKMYEVTIERGFTHQFIPESTKASSVNVDLETSSDSENMNKIFKNKEVKKISELMIRNLEVINIITI
jgi:hypothetical protein